MHFASGGVAEGGDVRRVSASLVGDLIQLLEFVSSAAEADLAAQHGQVACPIVRLPGWERFDVGHIHHRPMLFAALPIKEAHQVTHDRERCLDGAVSPTNKDATLGRLFATGTDQYRLINLCSPLHVDVLPGRLMPRRGNTALARPQSAQPKFVRRTYAAFR